jgi:hypothetical protein
MNKLHIISVGLVILITILNSIGSSQIEILINGNVLIEQINKNEQGDILGDI